MISIEKLAKQQLKNATKEDLQTILTDGVNVSVLGEIKEALENEIMEQACIALERLNS